MSQKIKIEKNTVMETLVLPLYGRAYCSEKYPDLFPDKTAEEVIRRIDYDFSKLNYQEFTIITYKLLAGQNSAAAYTGNLKSLTAGKICYYLDLRGPNVTVDSACSSSLVGMHEACMKIVSGECDYALIGGFSVNIYIPCFNDTTFQVF